MSRTFPCVLNRQKCRVRHNPKSNGNVYVDRSKIMGRLRFKTRIVLRSFVDCICLCMEGAPTVMFSSPICMH